MPALTKEVTKLTKQEEEVATNVASFPAQQVLPQHQHQPQFREGRRRHRRRSESRRQRLQRRRLLAGRCSLESSLPLCPSPVKR